MDVDIDNSLFTSDAPTHTSACPLTPTRPHHPSHPPPVIGKPTCVVQHWQTSQPRGTHPQNLNWTTSPSTKWSPTPHTSAAPPCLCSILLSQPHNCKMITKPPQVIEHHAQASQAVFGGNSHLACKGQRSEPPRAHVDHGALSEGPWWLAPLRCGQGLPRRVGCESRSLTSSSCFISRLQLTL